MKRRFPLTRLAAIATAAVALRCGTSLMPAGNQETGNGASSSGGSAVVPDASMMGGSSSTAAGSSGPGSSGSSSSVGSAGSSSGTSGGSSSSSSVDAGSDATPFNPAYILGADITWTQQDEALNGATYVDDDGGTKPILTLLADHGFNYIRLRTFVDPTQSAPNPAGGTFAPYSPQGFGDLTHTIEFGQQIKAAGMGFLLDFHYSDYWADPGKQIKPHAWLSDDVTQMATDLQNYTQNAISMLVAAGARPDMVQTGNEITPGMELSPDAAIGPTSNWPQLAQLLKAGINGVHAVDPTIKIVLHIDRGGDNPTSETWITNAMDQGVQFDVFGESCYVAYQGEPSGWQSNFAALATKYPNLKFIMAEYNADPADGGEITTANNIMFGLANHQGLGTFFWEPTHSGAWGPGLFTLSGSVYSTIPASIDQFDKMKANFGL